ncbi:peptide chain release factor N(5)-glutamine methyltransferase [Varunaivibrio sulfuroxidans]|uniref:Release factor glutamine methyltransferase n=1 Tax=Varunaivibrio sulfuroxidans TaxID=1773489 RepID=A0A4R3JI94_9PROT|nr:peptide chain release factor N(5)-glutamine methyltransferase [Varunaivibrio sulfuroxidans]TCS65103.1 release factor glutamine methyltransferase [Varunaivibrio sulfuroxidans]WES29610.1 peptide chain release factor N(5)-glutamine methyltransferase [Varunaivibrio sulfuroxidans]
MTRIGEAFKDATDKLRAAGIDSARLDARLLVAQAVGGAPTMVLSAREREMTAAQSAVLAASLRRRRAREPMAHILGEREFWSLPFKITAHTLIPRADSETLIAAALRDAPGDGAGIRILDIGVGSGCLLLTLLNAWPKAAGVGVDISAEALDVAAENTHRLGLDARAQFILKDAFIPGALAALGATALKFTHIVSNPPYIPDGDIAGLEPDVRDYEPLLALKGGRDGLDAYRAILDGVGDILAPTGKVYLEVGKGQHRDVIALADQRGLDVVGVDKDISSVERCVILHPRVRSRTAPIEGS